MYVMAWLDPTARCVTAHWTATVHDHARGGIEPSRAGSWLGLVKLVKNEPSPSSA
jgi:hypothetical protein